MKWRFLLISMCSAIFCGMTTADETGAELPERLKAEPVWAKGPNCGPNSLFVYLKLLGVNVNYSELSGKCAVDPVSGASVNSLLGIACDYGVKSEVRFLSPELLPRLPFPLVAHLNNSHSAGANGHFLVIFEFRDADRAFGTIDGTSGIVSYRPLDVLSREFSGYVLLPTSDFQRRSKWLLCFATGVVLLFCFSHFVKHR